MNLYKIPHHPNSPRTINAIIEIPKGTSAKYEYDVQNEVFMLDRCLTSAMVYPANYGFIPSTLGDDGDALDVLVYNSMPIDRGTLVECTVIGVLDMEDDGDKDYKILAAPTSHIKQYNSIRQVDQLFLKVTKNFFEHYKELNDKDVIVHDWHSRTVAYDIIKKGARAHRLKSC